MKKEADLIKEITSLDMMINALAIELAEQSGSKTKTAESRKLVRQMTDALEELRLRRGVRKMLLERIRGQLDGCREEDQQPHQPQIERQAFARRLVLILKNRRVVCHTRDNKRQTADDLLTKERSLAQENQPWPRPKRFIATILKSF